MEERAYQTPLADLRKDALAHYDEASTKIHCWQSGIPNAINFYWEYKQLSLWKKILLAFKK